jgi:prepilin-type N-terminal cleavage/methylation domain-containing protein
MKTMKNRKAAFTLVEIMIVVAIIGLLAAIAIPNFVKARTSAQTNACINNLRQIDGAIQQWALENKKASTDAVVADALAVYLGRGGTGEKINEGNTKCPAGGTYAPGPTVADKPTCSIGGFHIIN